MSSHRQIVIQELPKGELREEHFALATAETPEPGPGQILARTLLLSIDAANRAWMQGATYRAAVKAGDVMPGYAIAEVVASQADGLAPGDIVGGEGGWSEMLLLEGRRVQKLPAHRPLSHLNSVLGIAGKTAYHGLMQIGAPQAGETLVVSAAAGSVGIFVGQIGKLLGLRVVGIAGGAEKCAWLVEELGFDAAVDYRAGALFKDLKTAAPDGIDIYFDNVGGAILETVLFQMNMYGRVICCGAVSQYDTDAPSGPRNVPGLIVVKRLKMQGFIVMDYAAEDAAAERDLAAWLADGRIRVIEDIVEGLERAPAALIGLLAGENRGKRMVRVAPDPA